MSSHNQRFVLAILVLVSALGYIVAASFLNIPKPNIEWVQMNNDRMNIAIAVIIGYWFGSSQGSADKDKRNNGNT
jgi:hypothetical protein